MDIAWKVRIFFGYLQNNPESMTNYLRFTFLLIFSGLFAHPSFAQEAVQPRLSPTAIVTMKYEDSYVKITYCQPHKRGRLIFGELVPYGQVWRTGANEATEITVTTNVLIGKDTLKAGTYSVFTIPEKDSWTVIFNSELGQWGSYNYLESSNVLRIEVPVQKLSDVSWEAFTITFEQANDHADIVMVWGKTRVAIPVRFIAAH